MKYPKYDPILESLRNLEDGLEKFKTASNYDPDYDGQKLREVKELIIELENIQLT